MKKLWESSKWLIICMILLVILLVWMLANRNTSATKDSSSTVPMDAVSIDVLEKNLKSLEASYDVYKNNYEITLQRYKETRAENYLKQAEGFKREANEYAEEYNVYYKEHQYDWGANPVPDWVVPRLTIID